MIRQMKVAEKKCAALHIRKGEPLWKLVHRSRRFTATSQCNLQAYCTNITAYGLEFTANGFRLTVVILRTVLCALVLKSTTCDVRRPGPEGLRPCIRKLVKYKLKLVHSVSADT